MTLNFLHGSGYLLILFFFGDWKYVVATFEPRLLWQIGLSGVGVALYFGCGMLLSAKTVEPFLGATPGERLANARRLMWIPYLVGSSMLCAAALFHQPNREVFPMAVAEGFGAMSLLLFLPSVVEKPKRDASQQRLTIAKIPV